MQGSGLFADADILEGEFVLEYVGEVITKDIYEVRMAEYSDSGSEHYYFMRAASEYIDATKCGNESRFANHSCKPNCEMQKWLVDGETCVGLFSLSVIRKGEEITFDYNFESVDGKCNTECLCGTQSYRHYIDKSRVVDIPAPVEWACEGCSCSSMNTPQKRRGPSGVGTLCNACGVRFAKMWDNYLSATESSESEEELEEPEEELEEPEESEDFSESSESGDHDSDPCWSG